MAIIVRPVNLDTEREELLAVLEQNLADLSHLRRFKWLYHDNPEGPAWSWFVCDRTSGRVHGVASVFPRVLWLGPRVSLCGQVGDFAIEAGYRSLGPAVMLQRATFEPVDRGTLALCYDCPPHGRGMSTFRRLGLAASATLVRHARLLRTDRQLTFRFGPMGRALAPLGNALIRTGDGRRGRSTGVEIARLEGRFDDEFSALDRRVGSSDAIRGRRSADDLNWRYRDDPLREYVTLTARRRGELIGFAVLAVEPREVIAVDVFGEPTEDVILSLLEGAADEAREAEAESLYLYVSDGSDAIAHLRRAGFRRREQGPQVVAYAGVAAEAGGPLDHARPWNLMQADVLA
jgi:hypothetical protein